jgi:hypothetical protein
MFAGNNSHLGGSNSSARREKKSSNGSSVTFRARASQMAIIAAQHRSDAGLWFGSDKTTRNFTNCLMPLFSPWECRLSKNEEAEDREGVFHIGLFVS